MLELEEAPDFDPEDAIYHVLGESQMSEPEIAVSAGIPIAQTRAALGQLEKAGRVSYLDEGGLILWSRT